MYYVFSKSKNTDSFNCTLNKNVYCVPHIHNKAEAVFVLDGELTLITEHKTAVMPKNTMTVIMPYEIHGYRTEKYSEMLTVEFSDSVITDFGSFFDGKTFDGQIINMSEGLLNSARELICLEQITVFNMNALVNQALSEVWTYAVADTGKDKSGDILNQAVEYISKCFSEEVSLQKTAYKLGITSVHLSRVLNSKGFRFTEIVNLMRLRRAAALLKETNKSVSEIAYEAGFGSIRNFNRIFLKYFGCRPKDIRIKNIGIEILKTEDRCIIL